MNPMNKPEWFELVEKDGGLPRRTAKRGFRAVALSIPLLAIGIGVVVAQSSNEAPASAETTSVAATQSPQVTTSPVASTQPAIAKPPTAPTGGEDDENEGNDD
jgi:hypothetical protein